MTNGRRLMAAAIATMTMVVGCVHPDPEPEPAPAITPETCTPQKLSCDSTSARIELRAFIPASLPGANPPGGPWKEPVPWKDLLPGATCEFYGDARSFSSAEDASSRVHAAMDVPALEPKKCTTAGSGASSHCDPSHRRCPALDGSWHEDAAKTAPTSEEKSFQCDGDTFSGFHRAAAAYAYAPPGAPDIFTAVKVTSWTTDDDQGRVQHYSVDTFHTPFPSYELVVTTACGETVSLCQYSAHDPGPSFDNLGVSHSADVHSTVTFDIKAEKKDKLVYRWDFAGHDAKYPYLTNKGFVELDFELGAANPNGDIEGKGTWSFSVAQTRSNEAVPWTLYVKQPIGSTAAVIHAKKEGDEIVIPEFKTAVQAFMGSSGADKAGMKFDNSHMCYPVALDMPFYGCHGKTQSELHATATHHGIIPFTLDGPLCAGAKLPPYGWTLDKDEISCGPAK